MSHGLKHGTYSVLQKLQPLENQILAASQEQLTHRRTQGINAREVQDFYRWLEATIQAEYRRLFGF